jgi:hypothetical protein
MTIGAYHHASWKCVIFQYYLMNDTSASAPETNTVFIRDGAKKIIYFFIDIERSGKIAFSAGLCLNKVIAMDSARYCNLLAAASAELQ